MGVLDTAIDFSVFLVAFGLSAYAFSRRYDGLAKSFQTAVWAKRVFRQKVLRRSFRHARENGFLAGKGDNWVITQKGERRLAEILPAYREEGLWDGKIYLITYDIPESCHRQRDLLREYLKRKGAGMLQASVWLTPHNPKEMLRNFLRDYKLGGWVVVSDIGRDGSIGQMPIKDLVAKVYKLEMINERYREFLAQIKKGKLDLLSASFSYLAILRDDPQLPFALLPKDWRGEEAHKVFKRVIGREEKKVI